MPSWKWSTTPSCSWCAGGPAPTVRSTPRSLRPASASAGTGSRRRCDDGKVALYLRGDAHLLLGPLAGDRPEGAEHDRIRARLAERGACFFRELSVDDRVTLEALWDLVWAGEVSNDIFSPVRASSST